MITAVPLGLASIILPVAPNPTEFVTASANKPDFPTVTVSNCHALSVPTVTPSVAFVQDDGTPIWTVPPFDIGKAGCGTARFPSILLATHPSTGKAKGHKNVARKPTPSAAVDRAVSPNVQVQPPSSILVNAIIGVSSSDTTHIQAGKEDFVLAIPRNEANKGLGGFIFDRNGDLKAIGDSKIPAVSIPQISVAPFIVQGFHCQNDRALNVAFQQVLSISPIQIDKNPVQVEGMGAFVVSGSIAVPSISMAPASIPACNFAPTLAPGEDFNVVTVTVTVHRTLETTTSRTVELPGRALNAALDTNDDEWPQITTQHTSSTHSGEYEWPETSTHSTLSTRSSEYEWPETSTHSISSTHSSEYEWPEISTHSTLSTRSSEFEWPETSTHSISSAHSSEYEWPETSTHPTLSTSSSEYEWPETSTHSTSSTHSSEYEWPETSTHSPSSTHSSEYEWPEISTHSPLSTHSSEYEWPETSTHSPLSTHSSEYEWPESSTHLTSSTEPATSTLLTIYSTSTHSATQSESQSESISSTHLSSSYTEPSATHSATHSSSSFTEPSSNTYSTTHSSSSSHDSSTAESTSTHSSYTTPSPSQVSTFYTSTSHTVTYDSSTSGSSTSHSASDSSTSHISTSYTSTSHSTTSLPSTSHSIGSSELETTSYSAPDSSETGKPISTRSSSSSSAMSFTTTASSSSSDLTTSPKTSHPPPTSDTTISHSSTTFVSSYSLTAPTTSLSKHISTDQFTTSTVIASSAPVLDCEPTAVPIAGGFEYVDCRFEPFVSGSSGRALIDASTSGSEMTVEYCSTFCQNYEFFAVEYGLECYCGNILNSNTSISDGGCDSPCGGDPKEACGGTGGRFDLYKRYGEDIISTTKKSISSSPSCTVHSATQSSALTTISSAATTASASSSKFSTTIAPISKTTSTSSPGYTSLGCYSDTAESGQPRTLPDARNYDDNMTVEQCGSFCSDFEYFGIEYAAECYCGNELNNGTVRVDDMQCNAVCEGDPLENCGAAWRLNIYRREIGSQTQTTLSTVLIPSSTSSGGQIQSTATSPTTVQTHTTSTSREEHSTVIHPQSATDSISIASPVSTGAVVPCSVRNHPGQVFYLRTQVIYGDEDFQNLYIQEFPRGHGAQIPTLARSRQSAFYSYFDATTRSIAFYHGHCRWSGLAMILDPDRNAIGSALITESVGTARMDVVNGELVWDNDRFGYWLACRKNGTSQAVSHGEIIVDEQSKVANLDEYQLFWWDTVSNEGIDTDKCAEVQLIRENA